MVFNISSGILRSKLFVYSFVIAVNLFPVAFENFFLVMSTMYLYKLILMIRYNVQVNVDTSWT